MILCRRLDLFGRELLAVDGTRIKAVNNKDRNFTTGSLQKFIEAADKKLEDYLKRLDAGDAEERATGGSRVENLTEKIEALRKKRSEYAAHRSALEKNGESQVSLTDPDSRAMAAHTKVGVGYNIQVARSWRLRRSRSGFWRKMTKYSMNLHQIYRRSSIRRRFHTVC